MLLTGDAESDDFGATGQLARPFHLGLEGWNDVEDFLVFGTVLQIIALEIRCEGDLPGLVLGYENRY